MKPKRLKERNSILNNIVVDKYDICDINMEQINLIAKIVYRLAVKEETYNVNRKKLRELRAKGLDVKAVAYARFSSENQRDESIDAQIRAMKEYAERVGLPIIRFYMDKARSGTNDDRDEFQQMIADSGRKEFQFVIVHKFDRFARNRRDSMGYRVELSKNGVNVVSVLESFDEDTPEGKLMEGMVELLAEFYSLNLAREVKKGLK